MNKKKRYILEDIDEGEFKLISIHSNCEDFKLAYLINLTCNSRFIKLKKKVYENGSKVEFQIFEWIDIARGISCYLFSNRSLSFKDDLEKGGGLFDIPETKELYLIQDLKEADYIIKINSGIDAASLIKELETIKEVSYCYQPHQSKITLDLSVNF
tara:strand:- start:849 stop:1316 length:468 start_codon:yes stop_codon:yes gene_type:complete